MLDERLEEELRRALERPALASPHPAQARYRATAPPSGRPAWVGVAAAFSAGAVVTALVLTAGTGSANPRVWTVRVAAVVTQLEGRVAPSPEASPAPSPSAPLRAVPVTPSQQSLPSSPEPSPEPSEKPAPIESNVGGVSDPSPSPSADLSPSPSADPSPSPSADPSPSPSTDLSPGSDE